MKNIGRFLKNNRRRILILSVVIAILGGLLLFKLGSLTGGISYSERILGTKPVGVQAIYDDPFYLPMKVLQSAVFTTIEDFGQALLRIPSIIFGAVAVLSFTYLMRRWHGGRSALFAAALFATSAWTLHISRFASYEVLYLCAMPLLLLTGALMQRYFNRGVVFYGSMLLWGCLLYVPGLVWLVLLTIFWQRKAIRAAWKHFSRWWQRLGYVLSGVIWLPLLGLHLSRSMDNVITWLGAPLNFEAPLQLLKQLAAVFVHLFIRGPQYPETWLGQAPVLDIFVLVACIAGIYFYATHPKATRSKLLASYASVAIVLVALGGPVKLSLLVPLLFVLAGTGVAYLMRDWLQTFPLNPLARSIGICLVAVAVAMSCIYNLRAYFVAWPHNDTTQATFRYHR